jgi:hypothetical protein
MNDEELRRLLKSAVPPTRDQRPAHDLWPAVAARVHQRAPSSRVDIGIAIFTVAALCAFPKAALLIAYHL